MIRLRLPDNTVRPLPFYLAMEEWAARSLAPGDYFFAWRVAPTVICGRNQDIEAEVDLEYCRREGIRVVRRRSGGGAVYADMDNWMFSYITSSDQVQQTFARYTTMVASMLSGLGIDARANGRNDIVVDGRKISGNAFYHLPGRSIAHGTMLYDFDPEPLSRALTPSRAKLVSKGVQSVPMRVTSLRRQGLKMTVEEFASYAISKLTDTERLLTDADIAAISAIEQKYYAPEWLKIGCAQESVPGVVRSMHLEDVGELSVRYELTPDGRLTSLELSGDFFLTADPAQTIVPRLLGVPCQAGELQAALSTTDVGRTIVGLTNANLVKLLTEK